MKSFNAIEKELALCAAPRRVVRSAEARALANILNKDEEIQACIQGLFSEGIGIIVATNSRLLIVNKSFLWTRIEDESYAMINSILYKRGLVLGKLELSTRSHNYTFNVFKNDPIEPFMSYVDSKMRTYARADY